MQLFYSGTVFSILKPERILIDCEPQIGSRGYKKKIYRIKIL